MNIHEQLTPHRHHKLAWTLGLTALLLLFMAITNPSKDEHQQVIKQHISEGLAKAIPSLGNDLLSQSMDMIGQLITAPIISQVLDNTLQYHSYLFLSFTSIEMPQGMVTTSYGIFGKVFTVGEEKIASVLSRSIDHAEEETKHSCTSQPLDYNHADKDAMPQPTQTDTTSLSRHISKVIIKHVENEVKKQILATTDSATSHNLSSLIDDMLGLIEGL